VLSTVLLNRGSSKSRAKGDEALKGMSIGNLSYVAGAIGHELTTQRPDLVMLEDYSGGHTGSPFTLACTGEITGAAKLWMHSQQTLWREIAAATLKKYVTGSGGGKKEAMWLGAFKKFGIDQDVLGDDNNVLDAYCLARMGLDLARFQTEGASGFAKYEIETFKKPRMGGASRLKGKDE
jgi:Holliday junction resolvasome RuvABC endonuclease subunit